ncbi:MAG: AAA family ATPase [Candidatus Margulisbacteria bacterium]|nr:AAA family ATPase [Candidatus Margulisiibacteriota bacterium]
MKKILNGIAKCDRVVGAYLFVGPPGVGKKQAAQDFVASLKCQKQDVFNVAPTGKSLKIDEIRELQKWVRFGPSISPYLVVIVEQADTLTDQAAAAFLKTLEEPAAGVVFVLLAEREDKLPATILSRCQKIVFAELAIPWQADPGLDTFYSGLRDIKGKGVEAALSFAIRLGTEKDRIEDLLYELASFVRYDLLDAKAARIILDTVRYIKRRANLKLALDVMCLKLGGENV